MNLTKMKRAAAAAAAAAVVGAVLLAHLTTRQAGGALSAHRAPQRMQARESRAVIVSGPARLTAEMLTRMATTPARAVVQRRELVEEVRRETARRTAGLTAAATATTPLPAAAMITPLPRGATPEGAAPAGVRRAATTTGGAAPGPVPLGTPPAATNQTPPPVTGWEATGPLARGGWALDPQLSVSSTHVVVTARAVLGFYNKAGKQLKFLSVKDFFEPTNLVSTGQSHAFFDARTVWDAHNSRFVVAALAYKFLPSGPGGHKFVVAVSQTENPLDGFNMYHWDAAPAEDATGTHGADYPCLGVAAGVFYQTNKVVNDKKESYWRVVLANSGKMAKGQTLDDTRDYFRLKHKDGTPAGLLQPGGHHGQSPRHYFVSRKGADKVVVWAVSDALKPTQELEQTEVTTQPFTSPVDAPQLQKVDQTARLIKMTNLGTEILKAVYRDNKLYLVGNDARPWGGGNLLSSIRLLRLNVANYPSVPSPASDPTSIDRPFGGGNAIDDPAGARMYYAWPALEVNQHGDMVVVYSRSGSTIFPQVRGSVYFAKETDIRPSRLLKAGEAGFLDEHPVDTTTVYPWGDVGGASLDPFDNLSVWLAHEYTTQTYPLPDSNHSVWVSKMFGAKRPDLRVVKVRPGASGKIGGKGPSVQLTVENQADGDAVKATGQLFLVKTTADLTPPLNAKIGDFEVGPIKSGGQMALELDDSLAEAHHALAIIKRNEWDWSGAENGFKRAIELNPNLASAQANYANYLSIVGRTAEALAGIRRAQELDPLRIAIKAAEGSILYRARRYDEAIQVNQNVVKVQPDDAYAHSYLGLMYAGKGQYAEAVAAYQKNISINGETSGTLCFLGYAYAQSGKRGEALAVLDKLKARKEHVSPAELAILHVGLGDKEAALASLERAYQAHDLQMQFLKVDPHYDLLRSEARFQDLMRRVGLPQ